MYKKYRLLLLLIILCISKPLYVYATEELPKQPEPFIIDTDFSSDVDDAFAVSTAMWFQHNNLADVRGVVLCINSARGCWAMSALLGQHGVWDIPIANDWDDGISIGSAYHLGMTNKYPYQENHFADVVNFYRMMLASSAEPINIVTLGQLTNISALLNSEPDVHSPLTGVELVRQKVKTLYILGCKANGQPENNMWYAGENYGINKWYGTMGVTEAAINVAKNYPGRVVFMTAELGGVFNVGQFLKSEDRKMNDILTNALKDFGALDRGAIAFDPMGIYIAMLDANDMLEDKGLELVPGTMRIYPNGSSGFTDGDFTRFHLRVVKTLPDKFYMDEINNMLKAEFYRRSK